ncbi:MAG: GtrA family protein [Alistipes sp.]|nr:GtrA family protein [Alistipes sp.]
MWLANRLINIVDMLYIKPLRGLISRDLFGYGLCGAVNMTLDIVWYFLIYHYVVRENYVDLGFVVMSPHILSLFIVFPITFFTGFWLNRNVAFRVTNISSRKQLVRYALSVVGSILINYVCMKIFVEVCLIWPTPSKMLTTVITVCYSYLMARYVTFIPDSGSISK